MSRVEREIPSGLSIEGETSRSRHFLIDPESATFVWWPLALSGAALFGLGGLLALRRLERTSRQDMNEAVEGEITPGPDKPSANNP